jgi:hypothetical protein
MHFDLAFPLGFESLDMDCLSLSLILRYSSNFATKEKAYMHYNMISYSTFIYGKPNIFWIVVAHGL